MKDRPETGRDLHVYISICFIRTSARIAADKSSVTDEGGRENVIFVEPDL